MSSAPRTLRILRGKYRITRNVYACCTLDVLDANDHQMQLFLGLKKRGDSTMPVGTRIVLMGNNAGKDPAAPPASEAESYSVTVQELGEQDGKPLLICTPIQRETFPERRKLPRRPVLFPIKMVHNDALFSAIDGNERGLTLKYSAQKALTALLVGNSYAFEVFHKDTHYTLSGEIKHIHYDWKYYEHLIGVHFPKLSKELLVVLNLLIDPDYKVQINSTQSIDTSAGKISQED
jgi:hypothetical protein